MADDVSFEDLDSLLAEFDRETAILRVATAVFKHEAATPHTLPVDFARIAAEVQERGPEFFVPVLLPPHPAEVEACAAGASATLRDSSTLPEEKDEPVPPHVEAMPSHDPDPDNAPRFSSSRTGGRFKFGRLKLNGSIEFWRVFARG
jgi:hypothetical protein